MVIGVAEAAVCNRPTSARASGVIVGENGSSAVVYSAGTLTFLSTPNRAAGTALAVADISGDGLADRVGCGTEREWPADRNRCG